MMTHLRTNLVAYVALVVALGSGSAYAATSIANGSVTTPKLHTNAVTSTKIKNGTIKPKDLKKPAWVQSTTLLTGTPPAVPDVVSIAPYDFTVPKTARTSVTVFVPTLGGTCDGGADVQPTVGLYLDNVAIANTAALVPASGNDRSLQLTTTLDLAQGTHAGRVGITCPGNSLPDITNQAGAKSWTIIQAAD